MIQKPKTKKEKAFDLYVSQATSIDDFFNRLFEQPATTKERAFLKAYRNT